jgi:pSer/pThr/pTyr-binding forkhead associated (FHA) protein
MEGVLFCEDCGESLVGVAMARASTQQLEAVNSKLVFKQTWGTTHVGEQANVVLRIRDEKEPLVLGVDTESTFGRADPSAGVTPTFDLTPFGAQEKGVSRMHAAIRRDENTLTLIDLGSVNGTHLNGQRLIPNQPRILRDGDEIRLGKLVCHVFFE